MTKIKRVKYSGKPTFKDWNLDALDSIGDLIQTAVKDAMSEAMLHLMDNEGVNGLLWMDKAKPLSLSVDIPLGDNETDNHPSFRFDLSELIEDYIAEKHEMFFDAGYPAALVAELRRLADKIEMAAREAA